MANTPRYQKLTQLLLAKITSGDYKAGDRFFSQSELMTKYALSFATVTRALNELEHQGYLSRIQGKGTFIKSTEPASPTAATENRDIIVFIPGDVRTAGLLNFHSLYRGLDSARAPSMTLRLIPCSRDLEDLESFFTTPGTVGGVIYVYPDQVHFPLIQKFARQHPTVVVGNQLHAQNVSCISTDNRMAAGQAVKHLLKAGHSHIGIVSQPLFAKEAKERLEGYRAALQGSGVTRNQDLEVFIHPVTLSAYSACRQLLEQHPDLTAVVAAGDDIAAGIYAAADASGRTIPGDLSVVAIGDAEIGATMLPPVTTMHISIEDMARRAMENLLAIVQSHKFRNDILPAHLVAGSSTGKISDRADGLV